MKAIPRKTTWLAMLLGFAFAAMLAAPTAWGKQGQGSGQGQQNPSKPPSQPDQTAPPQPETPANPSVNAEEEAKYKEFFETQPSEVQHQIQLGEEFLKKYPESRYRESVYARLTNAYLAVGQEDKMFAAGQKVLEIDPDNVDVLALLALVMPRRVNPNSLDAEQKLQKCEGYAKRAISLLEKLQKPAGLSDADFAKAKNEKLSMCHSGLGFVDFQRQKYADAVTEFEQATKLASVPDSVDFYILGLVYQKMKRFDDAVTSFGHCAEKPGTLQERCKAGAEQAKKLASAQPAPTKP